MKTRSIQNALLALAAISLAPTTWGCVSDRPARNGVFNENQYVRKDFLVRAGDDQKSDRGWLLKATITDSSSPNPLGDSSIFSLYPGAHSTGHLVHFQATQDKLQMVNSREIDPKASVGRTPEIINAWPVSNVDLKFRVNLDGEKTNFYEENQELDWQDRQWLKLSLAKNDMSDLAPLGAYINENVARCTDLSSASTSLVPDSFLVDEAHDYVEWSVSITLPLKWTDAACVQAYGPMGQAAQRIGREYVTVNLKYSLMRANPNPTYQPLELAEKDPIRHKYGPIEFTTVSRDPDSGQLAARQLVSRFDPTKPIKWYFEEGFPEQYKAVFTGNGLPPGIPGIKDATNNLFMAANAATKVEFHEFDEPLDGDNTPIKRRFGDVRFNMLRWVSDKDQQSFFAGVTSFVTDPRTGETLSSDVVFNDFAIKDYYVTRIDAYLQSIGAASDTVGADLLSGDAWPDPTVPDLKDPTMNVAVTCDDQHIGSSVPIVKAELAKTHNGKSTLFQKMQSYMFKPASSAGNLGPQDFILKHEDDKNDFNNAYFALVPYVVYADPATNQFVLPEGGSGVFGPPSNIWKMLADEAEFQTLAGKLDRGEPAFEDATGPTGTQNAVAFMNKLRDMSRNHRDLRYTMQSMRMYPGAGMPKNFADEVTAFSIESVMQKDARHCIKASDGTARWETKQEWIDSLISTYWSQVIWHEFGHTLGLEHNFMASVDKNNFPTYTDAQGVTKYGLYASSVMEYNASPDRVFWGTGWAPYDQGAISWIYANSKPSDPMGAPVLGISGQVSPTAPWIDPKGFTTDASGAPQEKQFLYCNERHTRYSPLCRAGDLGTTPSEIMANEIDTYEWQYKWRNFRQYRKVWDNSAYATTPLNAVTEMRRFLSMGAFDFGSSEVTSTLRRIGVPVPADAPSAQAYYGALTDKFDNEMSHANTMAAAFHEAIIQQGSGERPYKTVYDKYFGDVTQQGIILDKLFAQQSWTALWPVEDYDPGQAAGGFIASYYPFGVSYNGNGTANGSLYETVAETAVNSMIGGQYDTFAYQKPLAVLQFAQDTHSEYFQGRTEVRDWVGGHVFNRYQDFQDYFRLIAYQNHFSETTDGIDCTQSFASCNYDPTKSRAFASQVHYSDAYNEFLGPDNRRWTWAYVQDRNQWIAVDRDRNTATYIIVRQYNQDVIHDQDDGNVPGLAYTNLLPLKYFLDSFNQFN